MCVDVCIDLAACCEPLLHAATEPVRLGSCGIAVTIHTWLSTTRNSVVETVWCRHGSECLVRHQRHWGVITQ